MRFVRAVLVLAALAATPARADLAGYVQRAEPAARVEVTDERTEKGLAVTTLELVSQAWRGKPWHHELRVFRPMPSKPGDVAVLAVSGSDALGRELAHRTGRPVATLSDVPNQPLYFGKREDDLLAHTFAEYLKTGDEEWPLLFPMTKSVVAAMNVLADRGVAERFVVTGASKRGWTSWLAGIVDERVAGIVPVVFDNLSFGAQMKHQEELWGAYSEELSDYTLRGLQSQIGTPRGAKLVAMVDPIAYRDELRRLKKLVVNGTNDPYWATDAIRQYWDELEGEKSVLYVPNGGHAIAHEERVLAATAAFVRHLDEGRSMPSIDLALRRDGSNLEATIRTSEPAATARVWLARGVGADFRRARFAAVEATARDGGLGVTAPLGATESIAAFAEADFGDASSRFSLSTPMQVSGTRTP
jgi:PhoPQ-activated pathogenicity-related protein